MRICACAYARMRPGGGITWRWGWGLRDRVRGESPYARPLQAGEPLGRRRRRDWSCRGGGSRAWRASASLGARAGSSRAVERTDELLIGARSAEAENRAAPGYREGSLILGLGSSAIGTLVELVDRDVASYAPE